MIRRLCLALLLFAASGPLLAQTWVSNRYVIELDRQCLEGDVTCDMYEITLVDRSRGERQVMYGQTLHTVCADGVSPCRFMGYQFAGKDLRYRLYETGTLEVYDRDNKIVRSERGEWRY